LGTKPLRQERLTHSDTLKSQETLIRLINFKLQYPFLSIKEKTIFPMLLANAFLSQANDCKIKPRLKIGNKIYLLGHDIHHFGLRLMDMQVTEGKVKIGGNIIEASVLWKLLKHYSLILFPMALSEAIHMSKEKEKMSYGSIGFDYETKKREDTK